MSTVELGEGLTTPAPKLPPTPETEKAQAAPQTLWSHCIPDTFGEVDDYEYAFKCIRAFAAVLWDQDTLDSAEACMASARERFAADKTDPAKFARYLKYCNTCIKRDLGEARKPAAPPNGAKRTADDAFRIPKRSLEEELSHKPDGGEGARDVDAGDSAVSKKLRTLEATLANADRQLKLNEQRKTEEKLAEALKSIPPQAQDFFMYLTAVKPLLDVALSFAEEVRDMLDNLEAADPQDDGDGLTRLAHGNVEGLRKAVDLSARSLKDMVLQHLVKGGSYALLQASRKNETFSVLGVEISDEIKKEARELQSDFGLSSRENAYQRKPYDKGRGHDTFQKGGRDLGSAYAKAKSAKCDRCGRAGHLRAKCWAEKHTDGRALGGARRDTDRERGGRGGGRGGGADRGRTDDRARDGDDRRGSDRDYKRR